mmetsp:Transcript_113120/g.225254  ORF Transcript_113120/g.225254 Transcript_113120/m.225254 type:complete len:169 (+) Transcript_113120:2-508(+)
MIRSLTKLESLVLDQLGANAIDYPADMLMKRSVTCKFQTNVPCWMRQIQNFISALGERHGNPLQASVAPIRANLRTTAHQEDVIDIFDLITRIFHCGYHEQKAPMRQADNLGPADAGPLDNFTYRHNCSTIRLEERPAPLSPPMIESTGPILKLLPEFSSIDVPAEIL